MRSRAQPFLPIAPRRAPSAATAASRMCIALAALVGGMAVAKNPSAGDAVVRQWILAAVFGLCLACFAGANFYRYRELDPSDRAGVCTLTRRLSRVVYLALYLLFAVNGLVALLCHRLLQSTAENLRGFLVMGVIVLVLIRAQPLVWSHISRHGHALQRLRPGGA